MDEESDSSLKRKEIANGHSNGGVAKKASLLIPSDVGDAKFKFGIKVSNQRINSEGNGFFSKHQLIEFGTNKCMASWNIHLNEYGNNTAEFTHYGLSTNGVREFVDEYLAKIKKVKYKPDLFASKLNYKYPSIDPIIY